MRRREVLARRFMEGRGGGYVEGHGLYSLDVETIAGTNLFGNLFDEEEKLEESVKVNQGGDRFAKDGGTIITMGDESKEEEGEEPTEEEMAALHARLARATGLNEPPEERVKKIKGLSEPQPEGKSGELYPPIVEDWAVGGLNVGGPKTPAPSSFGGGGFGGGKSVPNPAMFGPSGGGGPPPPKPSAESSQQPTGGQVWPTGRSYPSKGKPKTALAPESTVPAGSRTHDPSGRPISEAARNFSKTLKWNSKASFRVMRQLPPAGQKIAEQIIQDAAHMENDEDLLAINARIRNLYTDYGLEGADIAELGFHQAGKPKPFMPRNRPPSAAEQEALTNRLAELQRTNPLPAPPKKSGVKTPGKGTLRPVQKVVIAPRPAALVPPNTDLKGQSNVGSVTATHVPSAPSGAPLPSPLNVPLPAQTPPIQERKEPSLFDLDDAELAAEAERMGWEVQVGSRGVVSGTHSGAPVNVAAPITPTAQPPQPAASEANIEAAERIRRDQIRRRELADQDVRREATRKETLRKQKSMKARRLSDVENQLANATSEKARQRILQRGARDLEMSQLEAERQRQHQQGIDEWNRYLAEHPGALGAYGASINREALAQNRIVGGSGGGSASAAPVTVATPTVAPTVTPAPTPAPAPAPVVPEPVNAPVNAPVVAAPVAQPIDPIVQQSEQVNAFLDEYFRTHQPPLDEMKTMEQYVAWHDAIYNELSTHPTMTSVPYPAGGAIWQAFGARVNSFFASAREQYLENGGAVALAPETSSTVTLGPEVPPVQQSSRLNAFLATGVDPSLATPSITPQVTPNNAPAPLTVTAAPNRPTRNTNVPIQGSNEPEVVSGTHTGVPMPIVQAGRTLTEGEMQAEIAVSKWIQDYALRDPRIKLMTHAQLEDELKRQKLNLSMHSTVLGVVQEARTAREREEIANYVHWRFNNYANIVRASHQREFNRPVVVVDPAEQKVAVTTRGAYTEAEEKFLSTLQGAAENSFVRNYANPGFVMEPARYEIRVSDAYQMVENVFARDGTSFNSAMRHLQTMFDPNDQLRPLNLQEQRAVFNALYQIGVQQIVSRDLATLSQAGEFKGEDGEIRDQIRAAVLMPFSELRSLREAAITKRFAPSVLTRESLIAMDYIERYTRYIAEHILYIARENAVEIGMNQNRRVEFLQRQVAAYDAQYDEFWLIMGTRNVVGANNPDAFVIGQLGVLDETLRQQMENVGMEELMAHMAGNTPEESAAVGKQIAGASPSQLNAIISSAAVSGVNPSDPVVEILPGAGMSQSSTMGHAAVEADPEPSFQSMSANSQALTNPLSNPSNGVTNASLNRTGAVTPVNVSEVVPMARRQGVSAEILKLLEEDVSEIPAPRREGPYEPIFGGGGGAVPSRPTLMNTVSGPAVVHPAAAPSPVISSVNGKAVYLDESANPMIDATPASAPQTGQNDIVSGSATIPTPWGNASAPSLGRMVGDAFDQARYEAPPQPVPQEALQPPVGGIIQTGRQLGKRSKSRRQAMSKKQGESASASSVERRQREEVRGKIPKKSEKPPKK